MGRSFCLLRCFSPVTIYMHEIKAIELVCGGGALGAFKTRVAGAVFQPTAKLAFPSSFCSSPAPQRPQRLLTNAISAPLALARTGDPSPHTPNPHRPHPPPTLNPAHFPLLAPRTTHHASWHRRRNHGHHKNSSMSSCSSLVTLP
jgi:hypothetical protein